MPNAGNEVSSFAVYEFIPYSYIANKPVKCESKKEKSMLEIPRISLFT
jgi:hypothetical protein